MSHIVGGGSKIEGFDTLLCQSVEVGTWDTHGKWAELVGSTPVCLRRILLRFGPPELVSAWYVMPRKG